MGWHFLSDFPLSPTTEKLWKSAFLFYIDERSPMWWIKYQLIRLFELLFEAFTFFICMHPIRKRGNTPRARQDPMLNNCSSQRSRWKKNVPFLHCRNRPKCRKKHSANVALIVSTNDIKENIHFQPAQQEKKVGDKYMCSRAYTFRVSVNKQRQDGKTLFALHLRSSLP